MYTIQELEDIKKKFESSSPASQPGVRRNFVSPIIAQAFPELQKQPPASTAAVADVIIEDLPAPVAAKPEPVVKADPVIEEKIVNGTIFRKVRKEKR